MSARSKPPSNIPDAVTMRRNISVREAATILGIHEDTFRRHHSKLIKRVTPYVHRVELGEVIAIGSQSKKAGTV